MITPVTSQNFVFSPLSREGPVGRVPSALDLQKDEPEKSELLSGSGIVQSEGNRCTWHEQWDQLIIEESGVAKTLILVSQKGWGDDKVLQYLKTQGASGRETDEYSGNTPIMWAIANAHNATALALLNNGLAGDLDAQDHAFHKNTALHLSIGKGYTNQSADGQVLTTDNGTIARMLLENKANPNLQNRDGNPPLHLACLRHDIPIIKLLLKYNANQTLCNKQQETPSALLTKSYVEACEGLTRTVGPRAFQLTPEHYSSVSMEDLRDALLS